jgi:polyhydroxyalkanoate synthesis regulator phasin
MNMRTTTSNLVRKSTLAYVGAWALAGDTLSESFKQLAKRGSTIETSARAQLRKATRRLWRESDAAIANVDQPIADARSYVVQGRDRLLASLKLPTQTSLHELNTQIERLNAAIDDLRVKSRRPKLEQPGEPIPGYDKMNVDTVLGQLGKHETAVLHAIQAYEQAHQGRITVLRGVERMLAEHQPLVEA